MRDTLQVPPNTPVTIHVHEVDDEAIAVFNGVPLGFPRDGNIRLPLVAGANTLVVRVNNSGSFAWMGRFSLTVGEQVYPIADSGWDAWPQSHDIRTIDIITTGGTSPGGGDLIPRAVVGSAYAQLSLDSYTRAPSVAGALVIRRQAGSHPAVGPGHELLAHITASFRGNWVDRTGRATSTNSTRGAYVFTHPTGPSGPGGPHPDGSMAAIFHVFPIGSIQLPQRLLVRLVSDRRPLAIEPGPGVEDGQIVLRVTKAPEYDPWP